MAQNLLVKFVLNVKFEILEVDHEPSEIFVGSHKGLKLLSGAVLNKLELAMTHEIGNLVLKSRAILIVKKVNDERLFYLVILDLVTVIDLSLVLKLHRIDPDDQMFDKIHNSRLLFKILQQLKQYFSKSR